MHKIVKVSGALARDQVTSNTQFSRVAYDDVRFWNCRFEDTTWEDCQFSRVSFANGTAFSRCTFVRCRFFKQHTYFGGPSTFTDCTFDDCMIENVQFFETAFERCTFTGKLTNVLFYGPEAPVELRSSFREVDLSGATLNLVGFEAGFDLSTTKLPINRG